MNKNKLTFIIITLIIFGVAVVVVFWRQKNKINDRTSLVDTILDNKNLPRIDNDSIVANHTNEMQTIESISSIFNIDQKIAIIPDSNLLSIDGWKTYKNTDYGYEVKYPKEWFIYERELYPEEIESGYPEEVYFSTMSTIDSPNDRITPWARVVLGVFKKSKEESLERWLAKIGAIPAPGVDTILQYVQLGNKKFLGTVDFDKSGWKNAYFEISEDKVLKLSLMLQVEDLNYSKIFYSMIDNLRIK